MSGKVFQLLIVNYALTVQVLVFHHKINCFKDIMKTLNIKRHQNDDWFKCFILLTKSGFLHNLVSPLTPFTKGKSIGATIHARQPIYCNPYTA